MLSEKELNQLIGAKIRFLRKAGNHTLESLAFESEVDYSTLNLIENGKQQPRIYTLYRILFALNINFPDFLLLKTEKNLTLEFLLNRITNLSQEEQATLNNFLNTFELSEKKK